MTQEMGAVVTVSQLFTPKCSQQLVVWVNRILLLLDLNVCHRHGHEVGLVRGFFKEVVNFNDATLHLLHTRLMLQHFLIHRNQVDLLSLVQHHGLISLHVLLLTAFIPQASTPLAFGRFIFFFTLVKLQLDVGEPLLNNRNFLKQFLPHVPHLPLQAFHVSSTLELW